MSSKNAGTLLVDGRHSDFTQLHPKATKITVTFIVATAVRKFQKFESNKYKKSLTYHFHKQAALDELKCLYSADKGFFVKEFVKLAYFTRKFNLTLEDLNSVGNNSQIANKIFEHLKDGLRFKTNANPRMLHFFCLTLKYLTQNTIRETSLAEASLIAQLIGTCDIPLIKNELISLLKCTFEKLNNTDRNLELEKIIANLPELDQDVRAFLLSKMESNKAVDESETGHDRARLSMEVRKVKKNQQVVSKTQQTVTWKQDTKRSEETVFTFLNLRDCIKNQSRTHSIVFEPVDNIRNESGSDRSFWKTTWLETITLFELASQGQVLKNDDKDKYMPKRFLGHHYMSTFGDVNARKLFSFFINRMLASTFCKISRKQKLNSKAIDKLLKCVTDFENLVSVLDLKKDFVDFFVEGILRRHRKLKKITSPDIVAKFVKDIINKTSDEYFVRGRIRNTTKIKRKSYNRAELENIIAAEINCVRLDAITAIYNCAVRDMKTVLTKERVACIRKYAEKPVEGHHMNKKFMEFIFKLLEIAEKLNGLDYGEIFRIYLSRLSPESAEDDAILRFMHNQARDSNRSRELFSNDVMEIIIKLVGPTSSYSRKRKIDVMKIINAYLEQEQGESLSEENLKKILSYAFQSNDWNMINYGLTSLLLSVEKTRSLSQSILEKLFTNFDLLSHIEECTSYMVFILSRMFRPDGASEKFFLEDPKFVELVSNKILCDQIIEFDNEEDERVRFSQPSEKNNNNSSSKISLLSAKIILRSVENKVTLNSATIDNLLLALQSNNEDNKQVKIVASKCLYILTKYMSLEIDVLNQLLDFINGIIYDVHVYLKAAYLRECAKVAQSTSPLELIHMENISALYVTDHLILGQDDYEEEINNNFFQTLLYEARKQEFRDKNIFLLFDNILNLNGKYARQVLNILVAYSYNFTIPETTVRTLENLLSVPSYFKKSILILQNVIFSGKTSVTDKTLTVFGDYLCSSINSRLRFYSFKLLQRASQNQELPQDIFFKFELVRAGFALRYQPGDKQVIIECIKALTDKGVQLPVDTEQALKKEIINPVVLKIFAIVSRNKHIIEQNLLNDLIGLFDPMNPGKKDIILLKIFENAAKNNQTLSLQLLEKLEVAMSKKDLERSVIPIFIYLAQKGEKLSQQVNNKLLDVLSNELDPVLKQELLSSLGSLIDANIEHLNLSKLNEILAREIVSDNFNIQKLCINTIYKLVAVSKEIDSNLLEKLVQTGTDVNCNEFIRKEIEKLFESIRDNSNPIINQRQYREKIKLANLGSKSDREILDRINLYSNLDDGLLPQNYAQLKAIIDNGSMELQEEALSILYNHKHKHQITSELLESVAILLESTMSENTKNSCLKLLDDTVKKGKTLSGRAGEIWETEMNRDENLKNFFQSKLLTYIKHEFQLSDHIILDFLTLIQASNKISTVGSLADLIQLVVKESSNYFESQSFVLLIEQCLNKKTVLETALPCYCRIIKERKTQKLQECFKAMINHFCEKERDMVDLQQPRLFEAMYYAKEYTQLPEVCMRLAVSNLDSTDEIIRGYSFGILRDSTDEKYVKIFDDWCDKKLTCLAQNVNIDIGKSEDYLDLLEIIVNLKFLDVVVFKNKERGMWKRELLVSSIFETFKVSEVNQTQFYKNWLEIENKFKCHESCKILSLIQNSKFHLFSEIVGLTTMISELNFKDVCRMLINYGPEPYKAFKQDWCNKRMQTYLPNNISSKYSNQLAGKLCSNFDVDFIAKLFGCLKSIDNLSAFEDLLEFCSKEKINIRDMIAVENIQMNDFKILIEAKYLCECSKSHPENETEEKAFLKMYSSLVGDGFNFAHLRELVTSFNPKPPCNKFQNLLHLLSTIKAYNLTSASNFATCKQVLAASESFQEMIRKLNKLAIENHFQLEGKVKDLNELLAELKETNASDQKLVEFIEKGFLDIKTLIFENQREKLNWNEKQIYLWAKDIKSSKKKFSDYEAIAVILRANFLATGHTLLDVQILCCLIALRREDGNLKSRLLQVATGEGKSTIIRILAIINALRGKQVDVITSSPVLAERDAKQSAKLYRMFDLASSDNNDRTVYVKGKKDCYSADIVYGEMSQFQFDTLRDNYSKLGTLGNRKFTTAIVDEVDSMLIDNSSKIARLSSMVPGMDHFQAFYVFIWQRLISIKEKFIMFKKKMYFVYGKVGLEGGKITLELADKNHNILKIPDLEDYLRNTEDISLVGEVVEDIDEYLRQSLKVYLDCQIKENSIFIPSNFLPFLKKQKSKWITNAVEALNYQENVHYIVQDGEIKPVDYYSTGLIQGSTNWSDGLHQFLQLKHNLKMKSETLTTNFLSNIGFMKKYEQVYGLTGTLGSETAKNFLKNVYNVDLINIPQRRQKQYLELNSVVVQGEANWLKEITSNIMLETQKERGVLVICETIEHANRISWMLKKKLRSSAVKLYTMNDMDQEKNVEKILPGEVIIATNLAGRGTDIQTDEIEKSGGLHVILTFMPSNQRVEDQAFGRTARQGKRGTGLMILKANNLINNAATTATIKMERDKMESNHLQEFKENELELIQAKDKLFSKFCSFLNEEVRLKIRKKQISSSTYVKHVMNLLADVFPTTYECNILAAVEEEWAYFLRELDDGSINCEEAESQCESLISQLRRDFECDRLIKNPYCFINIANDILVNDSLKLGNLLDSSKVEQAFEYFKKAVSLQETLEDKDEQQKLMVDEFRQRTKTDDESEMSGKSSNVYNVGAAYVGAGWCLILLKEKGYKDKALSAFKTALKCLSNEMAILNATQLLLEKKQAGFVNSDLYKQLNVKATILGSYLNGINICIDEIKKSKRVIDIVAVKKPNEDDILEITHFDEQERSEKNKSSLKNEDFAVKSDESYSITFNHLTVKNDSGKIDQALTTMQNAFDEKLESQCYMLKSGKSKYFVSDFSSIDKSYSDIRISLKQVDLARVNSCLFNTDKEFKDLSREGALANLKEEQSYGHFLGVTNSYKTELTIRSIHERKLNKVYPSKKINELIRIIEDQELCNDALRFDIVIKNANKNLINKLFTSKYECKKTIQLNVDFNNLNQQTATAKLLSIKAKSFEVEFVLDELTLLKLIKQGATPTFCKFYVNEKQQFLKGETKELRRRVQELKINEFPCFVRFEQLTLDQAKNMVKICHENTVFNVSFTDIYDVYDSELNNGQANLNFDKLNYDTAKAIISVLRKENFEFSLQFQNLFDKQLRFVLKHADLEQEDLEIRNLKNVSELFMMGSSPTHELNEFASKGIAYVIVINEKLFVPWRSIAAVAALGVGQVILGSALLTTGLAIGMNLVVEGLADIFRAYRAYDSRQFHWSDYCKQKSLSLALLATSVGLPEKTCPTDLVTRISEKICVTNNLHPLKFLGIKAAEAIAIECLNNGIKALSIVSFDLLRPKISESVQARVRSSFCNTELMGLLRKMYAIDLATKSHQLQYKIGQIVWETINPRNDFIHRHWDSVALPLIKGVLSDSNMYDSTASLAFRFVGMINGLHQVATLTDTVANTLLVKLRLLDRNSTTTSLVFHRSLKVKKDMADVIARKLKEFNIFDDFFNIQVPEIDVNEDCEELKEKMDKFSDDWGRDFLALLKEFDYKNDSLKKDVLKCIDFVKNFYEKFLEINLDSFNTILKSISDQISDQLIVIMDSQLMQPWSTFAVSTAIAPVSSYFLEDNNNKCNGKCSTSLQSKNTDAMVHQMANVPNCKTEYPGILVPGYSIKKNSPGNLLFTATLYRDEDNRIITEEAEDFFD